MYGLLLQLLHLRASILKGLHRMVRDGEAAPQKQQALESKLFVERPLVLGVPPGSLAPGLPDATGLLKDVRKPLDEVPVGLDQGDRVGEHGEASRVLFRHVDVQLGELDEMLADQVLVRGRDPRALPDATEELVELRLRQRPEAADHGIRMWLLVADGDQPPQDLERRQAVLDGKADRGLVADTLGPQILPLGRLLGVYGAEQLDELWGGGLQCRL
ncbi:hypothetical protein VTG60DRAFT_2762 [Thermothelomyces hinnuleus]